MKKKLGDIFIQIIPVMIGVYLGFLVTDWADGNKRNSQMKSLVDNIVLEIENNLQKVKYVNEYHKTLLDSSQFYSNPQNTTVIGNGKLQGKPSFFKGTQIINLTSSAYNTGIQTGIINELPIEKIQALNQLYTFQETYNEYGKMLMTSFINKDFSSDKMDIQNIASFLSITMSDIVVQEELLIENFKKVEATLKGNEF
ncbi:hypothetical protein [Chondrinema litorale]|uniref:hypothetical protein n=1 Tax=Chondrinema litorale TaxID=2994555 RepID=UPI002543A85D|nr:hypothetical protein [Chondrinema litorale]UZR96156.1 hypothetical protein OQ292_10090 [Chondrinema litorale]